MTARREYLKRILLRRAVRRVRNTQRAHIRLVLRPPYYGMRCHSCRDVPPQLGEVMEPNWRELAGLYREKESNANLTGA